MRTLLLSALLFPIANNCLAQWCEPLSAIPYASTMPGITLFNCNTIARPSADIENYPNNSYINTGLNTTLQRGATYPVTIGFTIDQQISPHMNLRIWIDMNHDGQLDDVGETLLSVDHLGGPLYNGTITIPMTAMTGATRMRVTAKMCSHGGHSLPTPCDFPADPLGYHGEIEDYTATIVDAVGIDEHTLIARFGIVPEEAAVQFLFTLNSSAQVCMDVMDATGRIVQSTAPVYMAQGEYRTSLPMLARPGAYIGRLWVDGVPHALRFVR